jgi:hypothetical protein
MVIVKEAYHRPPGRSISPEDISLSRCEALHTGVPGKRRTLVSKDRRMVNTETNDTGQKRGFVMKSRGKEATMKAWAAMMVMLLAMTVLLVPITQAAEEHAYRAVFHLQKSETMEVSDVPGHVVGISESPGLIFVTKGPGSGEIGTRKAATYFDSVKGKGTTTGYYVYTFSDGSTFVTKAAGTFTPVDGGKRTIYEGTYEVTGGTGKFEGMKGKGTYKGERVGPRETGGDGYIDVTGTAWK